MLSPAYLSTKLTSPLPTKDGGTLRTIGEACEYMAAIGKERELRPHWQQVRELMLQEADVAAVSWRVQLAVLKDAKLDVTALSEPIERMMDEPPPAFLPMASSTSWKKTNHQQKAMSDPTATPRRSVADRKNSSRPKRNGQPMRSVADRKPKTGLFGTDSLPPGLLCR